MARPTRAVSIGFSILVALALALALALACSLPQDPTGTKPSTSRSSLSDGWLAMGTFFEVDLRVPTSREADARAWLGRARVEIARLESIYSRHDPASELSLLNRRLTEPGTDTSEGPLSPELREILASARQLHFETDRAFDIALGPIVRLWVDSAKLGQRPSERELNEGLARVDAVRSAIYGAPYGEKRGRLSELAGGALDLDGLSKGAVLDTLRADFERHFPGASALFSFGQSSIVAVGAPDSGRVGDGRPTERGWILVIRSRDPDRGVLGEISLRDQALSMSSSLGSTYEIEGESVSHVIDPRSGLPVVGTSEAIVIADSALRADAWSTAMLVLGRIPSRFHAEDAGKGHPRSDLEVLLLAANGVESETRGWPRHED